MSSRYCYGLDLVEPSIFDQMVHSNPIPVAPMLIEYLPRLHTVNFFVYVVSWTNPTKTSSFTADGFFLNVRVFIKVQPHQEE